MFISEKSWHYRLYDFSYRISKKFLNGNMPEHPPSRVNLCPYMRTIMIWGPIVLLLHLLMYSALFFVIFVYPFSVSGFGSYWIIGSASLGVILAGAVVTTFIFVVVVSFSKLNDIKEQRKKTKLANSEPPSGFFAIALAYIKGIKSKTCISLEVK